MHIKLILTSIGQCFKHLNQFNVVTKVISAGFLIILKINAGTSKIPQTCFYIYFYFFYKLEMSRHINAKLQISDLCGEVLGLILDNCVSVQPPSLPYLCL